MDIKHFMAQPSIKRFQSGVLLICLSVLSLFLFVNIAHAGFIYQQKDNPLMTIISPLPTETIIVIALDTAIPTTTPTPTLTLTKVVSDTLTHTPSPTLTKIATDTITYTPSPALTEKAINTLTHTPSSSVTATATDTWTHTPSPSPSPTATNTSIVGNTETPTEASTNAEILDNPPYIYAPIIASHWLIAPVNIEIENYFICDSLSQPVKIPDNNPNGAEDSISIEKTGVIVDLEIYLNVDHTWVGDLNINLSLEEANFSSLLIDRPGVPESSNGCGLDNIRMIVDDQASQPAERKCLSYPAAIAGIYLPSNPLSYFHGLQVSGIWRLNLTDNSEADTGQLNHWCLNFSLSNQIIPPTPTPVPPEFPESARIYGLSGKDQALPLDCESRSAVDWAKYFGRSIDELEFFYGLQKSDNPDVGFVGDVKGAWGQIPPNDYGVHAGPVAALLRDYGISAFAMKSLSWDDIRREVSQSRPVIAWVIGSVINGAPNYYTSRSDLTTTIVAKYEHTVIVIGYTPDSVIISDGDQIYERSLNRFLESWSALNNMAVIAQDIGE